MKDPIKVKRKRPSAEQEQPSGRKKGLMMALSVLLGAFIMTGAGWLTPCYRLEDAMRDLNYTTLFLVVGILQGLNQQGLIKLQPQKKYTRSLLLDGVICLGAVGLAVAIAHGIGYDHWYTFMLWVRGE